VRHPTIETVSTPLQLRHCRVADPDDPAYCMEDDVPAEGPEQDWMMVFHRSLGVTIFTVVVVRLVWRLTHPALPSPSGAPRARELISQVTHGLFYALLLLMPVTGYLQSADDRPVSYFGLFNLPKLPRDKALGHIAQVVHLAGQRGIYALVGLHVAATVWHVAIRRDGLLNRMIPPQDRSRSFSDAQWSASSEFTRINQD
jgi:cytochrome b561